MKEGVRTGVLPNEVISELLKLKGQKFSWMIEMASPGQSVVNSLGKKITIPEDSRYVGFFDVEDFEQLVQTAQLQVEQNKR